MGFFNLQNNKKEQLERVNFDYLDDYFRVKRYSQNYQRHITYYIKKFAKLSNNILNPFLLKKFQVAYPNLMCWNAIRILCISHGHKEYMKEIIQPRKTKPRLRKFFKKEEFDKLFNYLKDKKARSNFFSQDAPLIALLGFDAGLRINTIQNLTPGNFDFDEGKIRGYSKGNKMFIVPMTKRLQAEAQAFIKEFHIKDKEKLFKHNYWNYRAILNRASKKILKKKYNPHELRHSFSKNYLEHKGNVLKLKKLLGHSQLSSTAVYTEYLQTDAEKEFREIIKY